MAKKAEQDAAGVPLVHLQHETDTADGELTIGERRYVVTAGAVDVAADDYEAALQAGFRPA